MQFLCLFNFITMVITNVTIIVNQKLEFKFHQKVHQKNFSPQLQE